MANQMIPLRKASQNEQQRNGRRVNVKLIDEILIRNSLNHSLAITQT